MIRVGGATEVEVKETQGSRRRRAERHPRRGRGRHRRRRRRGAALWPQGAREGLTGDNDDQSRGIAIVRRALRPRSARSPRTPAWKARSSSASCWKQNDTTYGFDAQKDEYRRLDRRPASSTRPRSCASRSAERGIGRRPADHHRSDDRRTPEKKAAPAACRAAAAWAAWATWTSKSGLAKPTVTRNAKAGGATLRPFAFRQFR